MDKKDYRKHLYALIVAGGGGTRLWPRSRNTTPKQFLKLFKNQTLMQNTSERFNKLVPWENIFVVTVSDEYKNEIRKEVPKIPPKNILVEPARKNTAPAHALGASYILKKDKDAVIINDAADHLVSPESWYFKASRAAAKAAFSGDWLVALGVKPTYPNPGYGHIKKGSIFGKYEGKLLYKVEKFIEKPPLPLAKIYTASENYYWNANQYVWRADTYLKALKEHEEKVGKAMDVIFEAIGTKDEKKTIEKEYSLMPDKTSEGKDLSIDYAVSERAKNFLVLPVSYNWTDIGDWNEVWRNLEKDETGNVIIDGDETGGEIINIGSSDTLVHKNGRMIALVDVDNIVIVDTKDALLICKKGTTQSVKNVVDELKKRKHTDLL